jgi:hypothetical protein
MRPIGLGAASAALIVAAVLAACTDPPSRTVGPLPTSQDPALARHGGGPERVTICHAAGPAADPKFVEITVPPQAAAAHLGEHGAPRAGHEQDYLVTERTPCPPPAAPAVVELCVNRGHSVLASAFTFTVNDRTITVPIGPCARLEYRVGTRVIIRETVPLETRVSSIRIEPSGAGTAYVGDATATVVAGIDIARVSFDNESTMGFLIVCKWAQRDLAGAFTYTLSGARVTPQTLTVSFGYVWALGCENSKRMPIGAVVTVAETPDVGNEVLAIRGWPPENVIETDVRARTATVTVSAIGTQVSFESQATLARWVRLCTEPPMSGHLVFLSVVTPEFGARTVSILAPAGAEGMACTAKIPTIAGNVTVHQETMNWPWYWELVGIRTVPEGSLVSVDLRTWSAVVRADTTTVIFTNEYRRPPTP